MGLAQIPQIISIGRVSRAGQISLKRDVREHLGAGGGDLHLELVCGEVRLAPGRDEGGRPVERGGNRLRLPEETLAQLGLEGGSLVAFLRRPGSVALKAFTVQEAAGERAEIVDYETADRVTRVARTTPPPDQLLPRLRAQYAELALRHNVRAFLRGRRTFHAWRARQRIGATEPDDGVLQEELIRQRLGSQNEDGSWEGDVVLTARNLRELAELGLASNVDGVCRGASWLLQQPQSRWNPGMFFATDRLVGEQERIIEERKQGFRERFRQLRAAEKARVMGGDALIQAPCGPRIMWPNALVLEALLSLGYEAHARVQTALGFMLSHDWCECAYQLGTRSWRQVASPTMAEIEAFEAGCINEYRYGGIAHIAELARMDMTKKVGLRLLRVAHRTEEGVDAYPLAREHHIQGCEMITTRAMSRVTDPRMRRFAEAHLWRFASRQVEADGRFADERYGGGFTQAGLLEVFAGYDHPVSQVVIMRSLPWIVATQNADGSWGAEGQADASTSAIVHALHRVRAYLPPGLLD